MVVDDSQIFTTMFPDFYFEEAGFCFDVMCWDTITDSNVKTKVLVHVKVVPKLVLIFLQGERLCQNFGRLQGLLQNQEHNDAHGSRLHVPKGRPELCKLGQIHRVSTHWVKTSTDFRL